MNRFQNILLDAPTKPWEPDRNLIIDPLWIQIDGSGIIHGTGVGRYPTGWVVQGAQSNVCDMRAPEMVLENVIRPARLRRIAATGAEGLATRAAVHLGVVVGQSVTVSVYIRTIAGVTEAGVSFTDGTTTTSIASAATLGGQTDGIWVKHTITHVVGNATRFGFILQDAAIGTGVELAWPVVKTRS
jgi:hypothetical protein